MATIADRKADEIKWTGLFIFDVILKDATPRYWATQEVTFDGEDYEAVVLDHSPLAIEGAGIYGVDAVTEISLTLNNADLNLNAIITPANVQGGTVQPRFIFLDPDTGSTTTDSIVYPKFLFDLPTETWPRLILQAHNKWNLARKVLPASVITRKDRYPFPNTATERTAAGADPTSPFFAIGYDPANSKGDWKTPPDVPYLAADYDGTREKLAEIGLEVRFGGFGNCPPSISYTPRKGEHAEFKGSAGSESKYGSAVPLVYGICRTQPPVLDTGGPPAWNGARLGHYLLSDGVTFGPEVTQGVLGYPSGEDWRMRVWLVDTNGKVYSVPRTSNQTGVTGAWAHYTGYYGSQKDPGSGKYRNIIPATDLPGDDFKARDLYSGLAYLELGIPKELAQQESATGPQVECLFYGLQIETWDAGGTPTWQWTDNPVWIMVDLLKRLGWDTDDIDKTAAYNAAAYCDGVLANGKKRFRCNLALMAQQKAADILRGIRNCCRLYTTYADDGTLQLRVARTVAGEGGSAFTINSANIVRDNSGRPMVKKFHKSAWETANVFSVNFQDEDRDYVSDTLVRADVEGINRIGERISADSITAILGIPSYDQAERILNWLKYEHIDLNEFYEVTCTLALIENQVGQIGTITEARLGLSGQQCRIRSMIPGPGSTVRLVLQKHADAGYTDDSVVSPLVRAQSDSTYSPRSVGDVEAVEELTQDDVNPDFYHRKVRVTFTPPPTAYEGSFSRRTVITAPTVATTGGTIPGDQILFVEVCPRLAGVDGLSSDPLLLNIPAGTSTNKATITCVLPAEATHYAVRVGEFPGKLYGYAVAASPGTDPFNIEITSVASLDETSISPDPFYDHVRVFYYYDGAPDVLHDGGRTYSPTETELLFEPEGPEGADAEITVIVSSANAAETDFYPLAACPTVPVALTDTEAPSQPESFGVIGGNGRFAADWREPADDINTLDAFAMQWSVNSNMAGATTKLLGYVYRNEIFEPDTTYYFRLAAHNRSGDDTKNADADLAAIYPDGWSAFAGIIGPIYSGMVYYDDDVPEAPDPGTGQMIVEVFRMDNGDWKIVFGAEFPTTYNQTADWVQFQISRTPFDPTPDIVLDKTYAVPANDEFITRETHVWYIQARFHNVQGWGDWSVEVVRQEQDFEDGDDTGAPGAVQNLTVKSDDIDTSIPGKELLVQWDTPETNFYSLFCYAVQVHTGASPPSNSVIWSSLVGAGDRGGFFIDDTTANFTAGSHLNKTIWIHSASPMTDANLITTGIVKEIISTTRIRISPFPLDIGGTAIKYQIITPSWDSAVASFDVPVKRKDGFILTENNYEYIISRLPAAAYYVTVWAANKYGQGSKTTVGPYTVDGYKTGDIKDAAISEPKIASGAVSPRVMDGAARAQLGVFMETFEILPDWRDVAGSGAESIVDGQGQTGGKVYRAAGYRWRVFPTNIPFDSSKLYRMRARLRRTSPGTAGTFYIGLCGYGADGVTRVNAAGADSDGSQHYVCAAAANPTDGVWTVYTGWIKGWSASGGSSPSTDPTAPKTMHNDVRYFRPLFIANFSAGTETHDIDYIAIDVMDEEAASRIYKGINTDGTVASNKVVSNSVLNNSLGSEKVNTALRGWSHGLAFSVTDLNTIAWAAGTITLSDGSTLNINAGNTGNMGARTYIFLDVNVSTTTLQLTTTASAGVGDGRILIATAAPGTTEASYFVFSGNAAINVDGANIAARSITANEIVAGTITANEILAGTITTNELNANAINGMTITGAVLKTADSGARAVMDSSGFTVYSATQTVLQAWVSGNVVTVYALAVGTNIEAAGYIATTGGGGSYIRADGGFKAGAGGVACIDTSGNFIGPAVKINNGVQVVGAQGAAVADATDAATVIARLNDLLSRLRTHGLIAT